MPDSPKVRHVVMHTPGPAWQAGIEFRDQPDVGEHVAHYVKLHADGKLQLGGPFLTDDGGGMMVATADVSAEELTSFARADPAVRSGLLTFDVRPWYVAMERED